MVGVWRADCENSAGFQNLADVAQELFRVLHVLDDVERGHDIEFLRFPSEQRVDVAADNPRADVGAGEADFVINIAALKSGDASSVEKEMQHLTERAHGLGVIAKFIIETAYLTHEEKLLTCRIANRVRPDFMKTSTGFGPSGATVEDVRLMRANLLPEIQIKAAGGIRTYKDARALLEAGASRLGTSSGIRIMEEARKS